MRRALVQVHLWTGLALGLYVLVSSVTGAALVFQEELAAVAQAQLQEVPAASVAGQRRLTPDEAVDAVTRTLPEARLLSLAPPASDTGTYQAGILLDGYRLAFVHPASGAVTGPVAPGGAIVSWMHEVHANLLVGRTGRLLNGVGGLLLVLLAATGLVIWWPGAGGWRRALVLKRGVGWKRFVFDLHHVVGFWLLVPVVVLSLTGAYFTWPAHYRAIIGWFSPAEPLPAPRVDVTAGVTGRAPLATIIAAARGAAPGLQLRRLGNVGGGPAQPLTVFLAADDHAAPVDETRVFVDRISGRVLEVRPPRTYASAGDAMASWLGPLHTGHFGGPLVKALWAVAGLAPAVLFFSGFLMWWHRVVQPWRRSAGRGTAARARPSETLPPSTW